jgi:hypothetical protein
VVRSEPGKGSIVRASIPYTSEAVLAQNYGRRATDVVERGEGEDAGAERVGFFARLFGR